MWSSKEWSRTVEVNRFVSLKAAAGTFTAFPTKGHIILLHIVRWQDSFTQILHSTSLSASQNDLPALQCCHHYPFQEVKTSVKASTTFLTSSKSFEESTFRC